MTDLTFYNPTPGAADELTADIVLADGATGETLTVAATLRPRGLTPRTQALLMRVATEARVADASGTDLDPAVIDLVDQVTTAALGEIVAAWDVTFDGAPVDPAACSVLPLPIRSALMQGAQEAVAAAPKAGPKRSAARTNTAGKRRPKS